MVFLQLDKTHKQIEKAVNDFIKGEFKKEVLDAMVETYQYPEDIWKKACDIGLIGMHYPESCEGQELGVFENALVAQNLCRGDSSVGICLSLAGHGAEMIMRAGDDALAQKWLPGIATGEYLSGAALTEPGLGSQLEKIETTAVKDGDTYKINGTKSFVPNAGKRAGVYLVLCKTAQEGSAQKTMSVIAVPVDADGLTCTHVSGTLGRRLMDMGTLEFADVTVPVENLIGKENKGWDLVEKFLTEQRIMAAAQALGMAQGAFDRALAHVRQREQFGQKIIDFQITRQKLADMATKIEAAKLMTYKAANLFDTQKKPGTKDSSMAKLYATRAAFEVCDEAVQLFGGYGYIVEYEVERFYRDVKMAAVFEGNWETQKNIIGMDLLKGRGI